MKPGVRLQRHRLAAGARRRQLYGKLLAANFAEIEVEGEVSAGALGRPGEEPFIIRG